MREGDFLLWKAGNNGGPSSRRHTHSARAPQLPKQALLGPAASRAPPARRRERSRNPELGSHLRTLTFARLILSPASPPGRTGRLFPRRGGHRLGSFHSRKGGGTAGGQGAGRDVIRDSGSTFPSTLGAS
ncbi:hypothetical protein P7K49_006422 [Saguinus oedipus]|uniref:Uncharacterized protein n=1 Tax=Saguinus oedipus TaxID=9490 RepID=A0ABQ9W2D3_SAGOE|nr:hypothetical protein P7K49_006422 [Saguinus oedipus]